MSQTPPEARALTNVTSGDLEAAARGQRIEEALQGLVNLNSVGTFVHPNCPICNSPRRLRAEHDWLSSRNADSVRQFFIDHGEDYSLPVVKHHMEQHLAAAQDDLRKREWIERVVSIHKSAISTLDNLDLSMAALNDRMAVMSALDDPEIPKANLEKIKSDAICNLTAKMSALLQLRAKLLGEMLGSGEMIIISTEEFAKLFDELLQDARSAEERQIVDRVMTRLVRFIQRQ